MVFPHILALIDDELARLRSARAILSSLQVLSPPAAAVSTETAPQRKPAPVVPGIAEPLPPAAANEHTQRKTRPPASSEASRPRRTRRPPTTRASESEEVKALRKPASAHPVFVPAGQIRAERAAARQPQTQVGDSSSPGTGEDLTAEALAHRWRPQAAL